LSERGIVQDSIVPAAGNADMFSVVSLNMVWVVIPHRIDALFFLTSLGMGLGPFRLGNFCRKKGPYLGSFD